MSRRRASERLARGMPAMQAACRHLAKTVEEIPHAGLLQPCMHVDLRSHKAPRSHAAISRLSTLRNTPSYISYVQHMTQPHCSPSKQALRTDLGAAAASAPGAAAGRGAAAAKPKRGHMVVLHPHAVAVLWRSCHHAPPSCIMRARQRLLHSAWAALVCVCGRRWRRCWLRCAADTAAAAAAGL